MPIYEYVCKQCGKLSDVLQKMSDPPPESCPGCGAKGPLEKVISRTSFVLKGGGWYSDLYGSSKKDAKKDAKKEGGGESSSGSSSGSGSGDKAAASSTASSGGAASSSPAPAASTSSASGDKK